MRFEGVIASWNDERGFGFIVPTQGGQEIFVHAKAFARDAGRPQAGQRVSFEVELGPQGKKRARKVEVARPAPPTLSMPAARAARRRAHGGRDSTASAGTATLLAIPTFMLAYLAAWFLWKPPLWSVLLYLGASAATFMAYALDKSAAERGAWRTAESTLHLLALAGGWPGALLAQQLLRHKSRKAEFRAVFWVTVVLNVAGFVALSSPWRARILAGL